MPTQRVNVFFNSDAPVRAQILALRSWDTRKLTFLLALIFMLWPVAGLRPVRAARFLTCKIPDVSVLYYRVPRLFTDLAIAHGDGRYARLLRTISRANGFHGLSYEYIAGCLKQ